jgi:hypothetical protein
MRLSIAIIMAGLAQTAQATTMPIDLGSAASFAVLAGSTVNNSGSTVLTGDLGVSPGAAITGFGPGIVTGHTYSGGAVAAQAQSDLARAYTDAAAQTGAIDLTGVDLGGLTLTPGVYHFATSAQLTNSLTLNAQGDPNALFVFQIGSTLTTASGASVAFENGGSGGAVFWQVGSSATLGAGTAFAGSILALTSITLDSGATLAGRALARTGAVTLDTNQIAASAVPEPASWSLMLIGFGAVGGALRTRRSTTSFALRRA